MNQKLYGKSRKRALALSLGLALTGCDLFHEATDAEHVAKARAFLDKNDYRAGSIELKSALQKNPDNAEARRLLGEISVASGNGEAAEKELRKAVELGVAREAVVLYLAEALQLQGKNQQILNEIDASLSPDAKDRATLMAYRGDAWLAMNKPDKARAEYEQALAIDERSASAKLGMARLAVGTKNFDQAEQLIVDTLGADPNLAKAWSLKAEIEQAKGETESAEASYGKAIELGRIDYPDRARRALLRIELKKLDAAKEDIDRLKEVPGYFLGHYADGALKLAEGKYSEAQVAFDQSLKLNDKFGSALYFLALSHLHQNHLEQADTALSRFLAMFPGSVKGNQMMALVKFREKDFAAAKKFLAPVAQYLPEDIFTLKLMSSIEFALGNSDEGIEHLQKLAELEPDSPLTKARLGLSLIGAGETEKGLKALEVAVELDPDLVQADVYIALTQIRVRQFDKAQEVIDKLKAKMPDKALPLNLEGLMAIQRNDLDGARKNFQDALKLAPKDLTALNGLAQLALRNKELDLAVELFQTILRDHPKHIPALIALAEIQTLKGKWVETEDYLKQAVEANPEALGPRIVLARLYTRFGQASKAVTQLEEKRSDYGKNPEFLAALAEAQLAENSSARALETTKTLTAVAPTSALSHYLLARAQGENKDAKGMRASLEKSLQLDPKFFLSRLAMVRLLTQDQKPMEAEKYLAGLKKESPENPDVLESDGWFAMQQRRPRDAIIAYESALKKFPTSRLVVSLAQARLAAGEKESALETLADWIAKHPKDAYVRYVSAGLYMLIDRPTDAKTQLQAILEANPNNALVLNDLAWMLRKDDPQKGLEYAEKAVSLAPKSPAFLDTLAVILLDKGRPERALDVMQQAYVFDQKNPEIRYHLAVAYAKNARAEDARKILTELLNEKVQFKGQVEAQHLMKELSASKN
ncbi:XrtA/PEP-CTERM system TPR-repeat protein PrsT [Methylocaldum sp. MU1018]